MIIEFDVIILEMGIICDGINLIVLDSMRMLSVIFVLIKMVNNEMVNVWLIFGFCFFVF